MVTCFSAGCCGRHGNRPVRYCKRCHVNHHSSEVGAAAETHLYQTSPPPINTRECGAEELVCTVEAVIRYTNTHTLFFYFLATMFSCSHHIHVHTVCSRRQKFMQNSVSLSLTSVVKWACLPLTILWTTSSLTTRRTTSTTSVCSVNLASGSWCVITGYYTHPVFQ